MAESFFRAWWNRLQGRLEPRPCHFSHASFLKTPLRSLAASPGRILGAFGLTEGDRVLEIGPGIGYYSLAALKRIGSGRLVCLDIQPEMLAGTRDTLLAAGNDKAFHICGRATELPLRSRSFDHAFLITVLGEIPDRPAALSEIRRILHPHGRLSVSEQLPDPDFVTRRALHRELNAAGFTEIATRGRAVYTSTWKVEE